LIGLDVSFGVHSEHLLFCAPNKRGQYEVRYASSKSFREGEYIGNGIFTFLVKIIYLSKEPQNNLMETEREINQR